MKQIFFLTTALLCLCVPQAHAYDFMVNGIYYNKLSSSSVKVTSGDTEYIGTVSIPPTVTYNGTTYTVTSIGASAFYDDKYLTSVTIPNSVSRIEDSAFDGCSGLTSLSIPYSVIQISETAFMACSGLTSITVEAGNICYDSRDNCNAIIQSNNNELILGCMNTSFPNSVTTIGTFAFASSGLISVTIPGSVRGIQKSAFRNCKSLTSVVIQDGVQYVGEDAFNGCTKLTSITIPNSVTSIGEYNQEIKGETNVEIIPVIA